MRYLFGQTQQRQKVEQSSPRSGVGDCVTGRYCLVRQFAFGDNEKVLEMDSGNSRLRLQMYLMPMKYIPKKTETLCQVYFTPPSLYIHIYLAGCD